MALPFFYLPVYEATQKEIRLDEDTSRHVVQVLRMQEGEQLHLTDGRGHLVTAEIAVAHKKQATVKVVEIKMQAAPDREVTIAISLLKNASRFEWFLEKATEIGVTAIIPLLCERTEKEKFREDRLQQICISAMLQSQQLWLPVLHQPVLYSRLFDTTAIAGLPQKFIAHCEENERHPLSSLVNADSSVILVGPEGDFTPQEIQLALQHQFLPVTLGNTRLRTETAAVAAAVLMRLV